MKKAIKFLHISRKSSIFAAIKIELIMLVCCVCSACGGPIINSGGGFEGGYTCDCDWHTDKIVCFYNPYFALPAAGEDEFGDNRFRNYWLEHVIDYRSINYIMENIGNGFHIASSFNFKWNVSIDSKLCNYYTGPNSYDISVTPENYNNYFNSGTNYLEGSPYIPESSEIHPYDHKHTMEFQLYDVENEYEQQFGTITWTYTWLQPNLVGDEWWFSYQEEPGIIGVFTPHRNWVTSRLIYINGQYENIIM